MHFLAHFVLRRGNRIQARGLRPEQAVQLLRRHLVRKLRQHAHRRRGGQIGCQGLCVCRRALQLLRPAQCGIVADKLRRDLGDVQILAQSGPDFTLAAVGTADVFASVQTGVLQDFRHQGFIVYRPYAQSVACVVADAGARQVDFDVLDIFVGMTGSNLLPHGEAGGKRLLFRVYRSTPFRFRFIRAVA